MHWIKACLRLQSLLSLIVLPVCTTVTEMTANYNCTGILHLESEYASVNSNCSHYLTAQERTIGTIVGSVVDCKSPCKELTAGRIFLDECVNVTLAVICSNGYLTETRVHFNGIKVPPPQYEPENREHTGLIPSMVIVALVVACLSASCLYKCYKKKNPSSSDPV